MTARISIATRFAGPPNCGNGGYSAGLFAGQLGPPIARPWSVRLHAPLPLETALSVEQREPALWELCGQGVRYASATPGAVDLVVPAPPSYAEAQESAKRYGDFGNPRYHGCFVCGSARAPSDGLRIFPGVLPDRSGVAAPWCPERSLADEHGQVRSEIVWAALDCPGYFATFQDGTYALLGELSVCIEHPITSEREYVVLGWPIAHEGRKRKAGTALFAADGARAAVASATWIEVKSPDF